MHTLLFRVAGLDIHKKFVMACVRLTDPVTGQVTEQLNRFSTLTADPRVLGDWLAEEGVTDVALRSKGESWKPIWRMLEARFRLLLADKNEAQPIPRYLASYIEAQWLAQLLAQGLLTPSFIPEQVRQELHDLIGYRSTLLNDRTRVIQRLHRVFKTDHFKLSGVSSEVLKPAAREMLAVLVVGDVDPDALANLAHGRLHSKLDQVKHALTGTVMDHHRFMLGQLLDHLDQLEDQIAVLGERIQHQVQPHLMAPYSKSLVIATPQSELLRRVPLLKHLFRSTRSRQQTQSYTPPTPRHLAMEKLESRLVMTTTSPLTAVPVLNSLPGANATLYLDFNGDFQAQWGSYSNITTPAYDQDGDATGFSDGELASIQKIFNYVAEDYAPFNINVTTVEPSSFANSVALRVAIGGDGLWTGGNYGGVSYKNSFTNSLTNVAFVFSKNLNSGYARATANASSHEAGHAFGLDHQSLWSGSTELQEYYTGAGDGRSPIMGDGNTGTRSLWWSGTTTSATTYQDDMAVLANATNAFGYRADDVGNTVTTATPLAVAGSQVSAFGIITTMSDVDDFSFTTGDGTITLTVTPPASYGNLDTRIELRDAVGNLIVSAAPTTSFGATITTTVAAGSYRLVVASQGNYGDVGQYSVTGTIVTGDTINAPTSLVAQALSSSQIGLTWLDNATNETGYNVLRSSDGLTWTNLATLSGNSTGYIDTGASAGSTYSYLVQAFNTSLASNTSNQATATTITIAPSGLSATASSSSQINLSWSDVSGETAFKVERSMDGLTWSQIGTTGTNATSYQDTGLTSGTTYSYRVKATNSGGDSAASLSVSATTQAVAIVTKPSAPSGLAVTAVSARLVNLFWTDTSNNETGFAIERGTVAKNGSVTWAEIKRVGANVSTFADVTVTRNKNYVYRIRAYNGGGMSAYSNQASVTTPSASLSITQMSALLAQMDSTRGRSQIAPPAANAKSSANLETATTLTAAVAASGLPMRPPVVAPTIPFRADQQSPAPFGPGLESDDNPFLVDLTHGVTPGEHRSDTAWHALADELFAELNWSSSTV